MMIDTISVCFMTVNSNYEIFSKSMLHMLGLLLANSGTSRVSKRRRSKGEVKGRGQRERSKGASLVTHVTM